jgi:glycosyltransferase involved in cell wall biosynthesis
MTVLIPSYEPDQKLIRLILQIKAVSDIPIIVVDDGSGTGYRSIFQRVEELGCTVLTHPVNQGKGRALKTGFYYLKNAGCADGVVCADSDGQHLPADILRIAAAIAERENHIILGSRRFTGNVPFRSRFGNAATRMMFAFTTGTRIQDTQTGLRGYSASMLEWLCRIPGDRFEYEMNMLLEAEKEGYSLHEVTIDTVYLDDNKSSHFRPLADSARVYLPILKFSASSILSAALDFFLLLVLQALTSHLFLSVAGARLCSSIFNYSMNRSFVFGKGKGGRPAIRSSMPKYFGLVLVVLLLNYAFMFLYHETLGIPLPAAKPLTEASVFLFSYWCQRKFVYTAASKQVQAKAG